MKIAGFWEKLEKEWDETHRATLVILGDLSLVDGLSAYKLYINGNIHRTAIRFEHLAPPNSIYVRLKAGVHRVVLREYEVTKPDRMESNTLYIEIHDNEQIAIRASLQDGQLMLSVDVIEDNL
jgi:hypothetical protein